MNKINHCELLLNKLKEDTITPVKIAHIYKKAIMRNKNSNINWEKINIAIINKWNFETLEHIKDIAWKSKRNNINSRLAKLITND